MLYYHYILLHIAIFLFPSRIKHWIYIKTPVKGRWMLSNPKTVHSEQYRAKIPYHKTEISPLLFCVLSTNADVFDVPESQIIKVFYFSFACTFHFLTLKCTSLFYTIFFCFINPLHLEHRSPNRKGNICRKVFQVFAWKRIFKLSLNFYLGFFARVQVVSSQHWFR